jgi:transcriptional regulator GlxA family with amidase domain
MLVSWAEEYRQTLEREHRRSPALVVALRLQREFDARHTIGRLAKDAACSRSSLLRQFNGRFGVSLGAYLTLVRVRAAFHMLRQQDGKVEAVALAVGYRSPKNLYAALRRIVAMRPDEIRRLDAIEADGMLNGCLALPEPRAKRPLDRN